MALYGADVLNIWRPRDSEVEAFAWDVQVGMRSTILDDSKEDRAQFNQLLQDADVFFANKRPGFLEKHDLDADALCKQKPGLIHATIVLHGEKDYGRTGLGSMKSAPQFLAFSRLKVPQLGRNSRRLCRFAITWSPG